MDRFSSKKLLSLLMALMLMATVTACGSRDNEDLPEDAVETELTEDVSDAEEMSEEDAPEESDSEVKGADEALEKAAAYLDFSAFSYSGLIKQLEFDGFTTEDATNAADNCGADWKEQAAKKAQSYLDFSEFSREELIEQLKYEGFTEEEADFGVSEVGL